MDGKKLIIAGGGIGGLTAALCLHESGFDVQVYESALEIKALGVGINLLPHAVRVLKRLGLQEQLHKVAIATRELVYYSKHGKKIWQEARGQFAGYNWPQFSIHRGTFQMLLFREVKERLGEDKVQTGFTLHRAVNKNNLIEVTFINKETNSLVNIEGDAIVAADGIHSALRRQLYPDEGPPRSAEIILHRGVTKAKPFLTGSSMIMAGSADKKFVAYPIGSVSEAGDQLINWIADLRVGPGQNFMPQDWNRRADKNKLLREFNDWHFEWLNIPSLIDGAEVIYEFPMSDRDPLPQWTFGHITMLGDAAHPMYPIGSNGASQAILDAECLSESLEESDDIGVALHQYEAIRLPATARIVLQNRQMGPEQVMQIVEERAPDGFDNLDDVISKEELESIAARYKQIAGFDKEALNKIQ